MKMIGDKRCKRKCSSNLSFCWQHSQKSTPKMSPKSTPKMSPKKSPKKSLKSPKTQTSPNRYISLKTETPRNVSFAESPQIKYIPPRNSDTFRGIAWAEEVTDLQAICVSSVLDFYNTWDRDTFENEIYSPKARKLVNACLSVMENRKITAEEETQIIKFAQRRERKRDEYRRERIRGFDSF